MPRTIPLLAVFSLGLWTSAGYGASPPTAVPGKPSFDCAKAASGAEKLVCGDAQLTTLDRETAQLYRLASSHVSGKQLTRLRATQRGWIKGRDDCWKASDHRACVLASYAGRIHELRGFSPAARAGDTLSKGPFAVSCPGVDAKMSATFINTPPDLVQLQWADRQLTLTQGMSASGVRYVGTGFDGDYVFWEKGREALFSRPGKPDAQCQLQGG
jgi:uncharacterized protein